jgi:lipopolysaccharide export LptBFGC system permease protein LptF
LLRQRRFIRYTAWPAGFLLVTTLAAFGFQLKTLRGSDPILSGVIVILMALAVVVSFEVLKVIRTKADRV